MNCDVRVAVHVVGILNSLISDMNSLNLSLLKEIRSRGCFHVKFLQEKPQI